MEESEKRREEARKIFGGADVIIEKNVKILNDNSQFSIKIPKIIVKELGIDDKKDFIKMKLIIPPFHTGEKANLEIKLIQDGKEE